jgi:magnesium transporter
MDAPPPHQMTVKPARRKRNTRRPTGSEQPAGSRPGRKSPISHTADERVRIRLFDADRTDVVLSLDQALASRPTDRQLLWVDIVGDLESGEVEKLARHVDLDAATRAALERPGDRPRLALRGDYLNVRVKAEPNDKHPAETPWLDVVAGRNLVITHHESQIGLLEEMDQRINADTSIGTLDAAAFVGSLLDGVVTSYFGAVDAIQDRVDELDAKSLRERGRGRLLEDLVALRHRIAQLRRLLADQRGVFAALAGPEVVQVAGEQAAALQAVAERFESALGAVEDSRDMLLGSFEVFMTRTAQRTNDVMKVLAFATVLLLPGSLIAGLLGMNVTVPLPKDDPISFWIVVGGVFLLAMGVVAFARARQWL